MTKRITDLESAAEESSKRNSEKSKTLREELAAEYTDTIEKLSTEKATLEKRFEDKRRLSKETETTLNGWSGPEGESSKYKRTKK